MGIIVTKAAGLVPSQNKLYDYRSSIQLQDDFLTGYSTSGNIGTLGWGFAGGTVTAQSSEVNHPGIIRRDTGAVAATVTRLDLNILIASAIDPTNLSLVFVIRLGQSDTDTNMRVGAFNATFSNPPVNGIYFEKLYADSNWFAVTRAASTQTRTDTGVATGTDWVTLKIHRSTSGVYFYVNHLLVATHTDNMPSVTLDPACQIINQAAASKTFDIDYFELEQGLTR